MITRFLKILKKTVWFIPAFLLWASYPPISEKTDVFFALAPLVWFARNRSPRESFKLWFWNGFIFWFGTLAWMPAIVENGGPWILVVAGWGGLAAYCALYFGLFGYLSSRIWQQTGRVYWKRILAIVLAEPVLWVGLELVRSNLMGGFAWNHLGVPVVRSGFGAGAALGGVYVLSMMVILVNGTVASIAERILRPWWAARKKQLRLGDAEVEVSHADGQENGKDFDLPKFARSVETLLPMLVIFGLHFCGKSYVPEVTSENSKELSVGLIQRNFPCVFKEPDQNPLSIYSDLFSGLSGKSPDLIVLPESAFSEFECSIGTRQCEDVANIMLALSGAKGVVGGGCRESCGSMYNSAALYLRDPKNPAKTAMQVYDKVHLVPFGEYIPGDEFFPALKDLAPVGSCTRGEPKLLDFNGIKLGVAICFEDTDSQLVRKFAEMGADVLVFITNDSWFSGSSETEQHAWQAFARSAETGLPVVRVGNSGVTTVYYPDGKCWQLEGDRKGAPLVDERGCGYVKLAIPCDSSKIETPYVKYGDIPLSALFVSVLVFALPWRMRRNKNNA